MKNTCAVKLTVVLVLGVLGAGSAGAQANPLDPVIKKMDAAAASFRNTRAAFEWDHYEKVIGEVDTVDTGEIYYRRAGKEIQMLAEVTKPDKKYVLFSSGKIQMYAPKLDQLTVHDLGKRADEFESFLVLGFGGSGEDMLKQFDVTYLGPETVDSVATAKLQLIPKSPKVKETFARILLWIDLDRGISVQQQLFDPGGSYRLAKYSTIRLNEKKFPSDVFRLKTTSKTQTITPGAPK